MLKARVAVFVTGGGTNLQAILDADLPSAEVVLVVSNRAETPALERARLRGIPALAIAEKRAAFEARALAALAEYRVDAVALAGFLMILSAEFIRHYPGRILNVHPALIPAFCGKGMYGLRVHEAVLARGVRVTGATVHLVDAIPDGGPILSQKAVPVLPGDTPEALQRRVMEQAEWVLLPEALERICAEIVAGAR